MTQRTGSENPDRSDQREATENTPGTRRVAAWLFTPSGFSKLPTFQPLQTRHLEPNLPVMMCGSRFPRRSPRLLAMARRAIRPTQFFSSSSSPSPHSKAKAAEVDLSSSQLIDTTAAPDWMCADAADCLRVLPDFVTEEEEGALMEELDPVLQRKPYDCGGHQEMPLCAPAAVIIRNSVGRVCVCACGALGFVPGTRRITSTPSSSPTARLSAAAGTTPTAGRCRGCSRADCSRRPVLC